jgi:hypothetical protein
MKEQRRGAQFGDFGFGLVGDKLIDEFSETLDLRATACWASVRKLNKS